MLLSAAVQEMAHISHNSISRLISSHSVICQKSSEILLRLFFASDSFISLMMTISINGIAFG